MLAELSIESDTTCCIYNNEEMNSAFNGFARVIRYKKKKSSTSVTNMISLFEGIVDQANYSGFGREIIAYRHKDKNQLFIGFFKPEKGRMDHVFESKKVLAGTGVFLENRKLKYQGIYKDG